MPSQPPSVYFSSSLFVFALYSKSESILSWSIQDKPVLGRGSTENKEGGRKTKNEKDAYGFRVCCSVKFMNVSAQHQWWKAYYSQVKIKYKKNKTKANNHRLHMHHLPFMSSITKKDWTGMACLFSKKTWELKKKHNTSGIIWIEGQKRLRWRR